MCHICRSLLIMELCLIIGRQWSFVWVYRTIFRYTLTLIVAVATRGIIRKSGIRTSYLLRILGILSGNRLKENEYEE